MAGRDDTGWTDVSAERLEDLQPKEFEEFCCDLVQYELFERHRDPPRPDGPVDGPDGGRDILITVKNPPLTSKQKFQREHHLSPLTEDPIPGRPATRTAYSCKSGDNWLELALRDAKDRAERAVDVLLEGGYFKLLISTTGKLDACVVRGKKGNQVKATPHEHIATALWNRLKKKKPDAEDPGPRIEIVDAGSIAHYLHALQPEGGGMGRWLQRFELSPLLDSLEEWRGRHIADRQEPIFEEDAPRADIRDQLMRLFRAASSDVDDRIACLVGPPGVGKTRLVLNLLANDPALAQRVRVATSPEKAGDALDARRMLRRHPAALLIVDDALREEAEDIAVRFRAAAGSGSSAHLLVLVPASGDGVKNLRIRNQWFVEPLDVDAARRVVSNELDRPMDDPDVVRMARLSGGFPWFARLLAVEAREQGRAPVDMKEAVRWALASRREASTEPERAALRERRGKSLLAAALTSRIDWMRLSQDDERQIAAAVVMPTFQDLLTAAVECDRRGILRRRLDWHFKYVTPAILEREVIAWLLGPDGSDPGGRKLTRHGQPYLNDFFETLERLGLPKSLTSDIARIGIEDLCAAPLDWRGLHQAGLLGPRLMFTARRHPVATARELRRRIEATDLDELQSCDEGRRGLVYALQALTGRNEGFEDAEAALFRLARAENEPYRNNATGCWTDIFLVELNETYVSLAMRLRLLEARLNDPEPTARLLALAGIGAVLATQAFRFALEPMDGPWPTPTPLEARQGRVHAWALLASRFADPDLNVGSHAKKLAYDELRGAIRTGLGDDAMAAIASHLADFSDTERVQLREKLEEVRTYDAGWLDPHGEYPERLERLLAPTSFRERLRQQVGVWGPAGLRKDDEARDDDLAREGLAGDPPPLLAELDWLVSDEAQRAHMFAYAMGSRDERGLLLAGLRERAKAWRTFWKARLIFARYLGEWSKVGDHAEEVNILLRDMRANPVEAPVLALSIVEVGATPERIAWIESSLRAGDLDAGAVMELSRRRYWLDGVSEDDVASLVGVLVEGAEIAQPAAALEILVDHIKQHPAAAARLAPLLLCALERLARASMHGMTDHYWELGAAVLIDRGEVAPVAELAVAALSRVRGSNDFAWATLHRAAEHDAGAVWDAISAALDRRDADTARLLMAFRFHRMSFAWPRDEVLAWVGHDERRGRAVVSLVRPYTDELDQILRALIRRFGAHSSVAREIAARIESTEGLTSSLAQHDARQLERARKWLTDADPVIADFAARLVEILERSHEQHAAYEEDERRRYGT